MKKTACLLLLLLALFLLSACGATAHPEASPSPQPTPILPEVTAAPPTPIPTPEPAFQLLGSIELDWPCGIPFQEPGYRVNLPEGLDYRVEQSGELIAWKPGDYTLEYQLWAEEELLASCCRTVHLLPGTLADAPEDPPEEKIIYLTFDDGPCEYTGRVLDLLEQYEAKATFFVLTKSKYCEEYLPRMQEAGHTIGIHADRHGYDTLYLNAEYFFRDFMLAQQKLYDYTGQYARFSRFPGGSRTARGMLGPDYKTVLQGLSDMGVRYVDWNVQPESTEGTYTTAQNFREGVQKQSFSVTLQHDTRLYSVNALEQMLQWGTENGYRFLAIDENTPLVQKKLN